MRFSKKTTLLLVFTALCLVGCAHYLSKLNTQKGENLEQKYSLISDSVYESIENELGKPLYAALTMANNTFLHDFLLKETELDEADFTAQTIGYLSALKDTIGAQTAFLVSDQSRRYYTFSGFNKIVNPESDSHDVWYSVFTNSRKNTISMLISTKYTIIYGQCLSTPELMMKTESFWESVEWDCLWRNFRKF